MCYSSFSISFTIFNIGVISNDKINAVSKIRKIVVPSKNIKLTTYPKRQNTIKKQIKRTIEFKASTPFWFLRYFKLDIAYSLNKR